MKRGWIATVSFILIAIFLSTASCDNAASTVPKPTITATPSPTTFTITPSPTPEKSNFNFIFADGMVGVLDTFNGTYTRDMFLDPWITVNLTLSEEEMDTIYQKMVEMDFFNYPDEFKIIVPKGEVYGVYSHGKNFYFKVQYKTRIKELRWYNDISYPDEKAKKIEELGNLIRKIIQAKEEYKKIPQPRGGYV